MNTPIITEPNPLYLYYISTDCGCGIRAAHDETEVWDCMAREIGTNNVRDIRPATSQDLAWVRGMGGYVPKGEMLT